MAVLLGAASRILVQGFGRAGQLQARISRSYGSAVVAGVTPGRGGQRLAETPVVRHRPCGGWRSRRPTCR